MGYHLLQEANIQHGGRGHSLPVGMTEVCKAIIDIMQHQDRSEDWLEIFVINKISGTADK